MVACWKVELTTNILSWHLREAEIWRTSKDAAGGGCAPELFLFQDLGSRKRMKIVPVMRAKNAPSARKTVRSTVCTLELFAPNDFSPLRRLRRLNSTLSGFFQYLRQVFPFRHAGGQIAAVLG